MKLPEISNDVAVTPQVRSNVTGAEVAAASPFAIAADALGELGQRLTVNAEEYARGVQLARTAKEIDAAKTAALNISNQAHGNPETFEKAWSAYATSRLADVPESDRFRVEASLVEIGGNAHRSLIQAQIQRDSRNASDAVATRAGNLADEAVAYVERGGDIEDPGFQWKLAEYHRLVNERVGNPLFGYSGARGALDKKKLDDRLAEAAVTGNIVSAFQTGGEEAARTAAAKFMKDSPLPLEDAQRIATKALSIVGTMNADGRQATAALSAMTADDIASIEDTGKGVVPDPEGAAAHLPAAQGAKYLADRQDATDLYNATNDFGTAMPDAIEQRLVALQPKAGAEGYARADKLYTAAVKRADAAIKLRKDDPAKAAGAFSRVQAAEKALDPAKPETVVSLIDERLAAQDALGLPEFGRDPLTKDEALALAAPLTAALPGASGSVGPEQVKAMNSVVATVQATYGKHAPDVLRQVLQVHGVSRDLAGYGATMLTKLANGQVPTRADGRTGDRLGDASNAESGMAGSTRVTAPAFRQVPNMAQINRLLASPDLASQFDEKFGAGTARYYLDAEKLRADARKGFSYNADGSENYDPGAAK